MPSRKIKAYLEEAGVPYRIIEHDTVYTAQELAAVTHVKGKEIAKAVMVKADDELVMVVVPSTHMIDFELLKKQLKKNRVSLAREEEFSPLFPDCEIGAMPPLGNLYNVDTIVAKSLSDDTDIVFNAGTHHDIVKISYADFEKLEKPILADITTHI